MVITQIERILVGVDGSENSLRAVQFAAVLAKKFESEISLVHIIPPSDHAVISGKATYMEKDTLVGGQSLKAAERSLTMEKVPFRSSVEFGNPTEQLLLVAKEHDLVVVGTRGLTPFKEALIGSTSHGLAQLSKVPVVIVP
ncbi:MAG: universal stress protein [Methanomassiliicoccales archaeon]|nr:universal stress protein [Methanomassiliicoccales archaeon]TFG54915.1 MAG: universal stress protein [Methanomassiliicoccus sp.]